MREALDAALNALDALSEDFDARSVTIHASSRDLGMFSGCYQYVLRGFCHVFWSCWLGLLSDLGMILRAIDAPSEDSDTFSEAA
ncbi:hypothetical protein [Sorangium sp. So ce1151]|uniref:hypothetical protein n=1 Tax=Sorangium sp. So ce1151 TaxID=3133332 RepID=UPI003F62B94C